MTDIVASLRAINHRISIGSPDQQEISQSAHTTLSVNTEILIADSICLLCIR